MTFRFATLILVLALSACGFHLRGAMALPYNLDPVKVVSTDRYSPLALTLAEALTRAGATPATADTENPAVLELLAERWGDTPVSVDERGRAQEFSLRYAVVFELRNGDGTLLVPRDVPLAQLPPSSARQRTHAELPPAVGRLATLTLGIDHIGRDVPTVLTWLDARNVQIRSASTRYTMRCSWVRRRDQQPRRRCFSGSGFPIPTNGSRRTAATRSRMREAVRGSVRIQCPRSSRNWSWTTMARRPAPG